MTLEELLVGIQSTIKFNVIEQSLHGDTKCWTSAYHNSQEAGTFEGTDKDCIDH